MRVHKSDIPREGLEITVPTIADLLDAGEMEREGIVSLSAEGRLRLSWNGHAVRVEGRLIGSMAVACTRCLAPIPLSLTDDFRFFLREALSEEEITGLSGQDNDPALLDYGFLDEGALETDALFREQLLLQVPMQALCRSDCLGLCQQCGRNLNEHACSCRELSVGSPFDCLRHLKLS